MEAESHSASRETSIIKMMSFRLHIAICVALAAAPSVAQATQQPAVQPAAQQGSVTPSAPEPSAVQRFPFPGETAAPDATAPPPIAPTPQPSSTPTTDAAHQFPFPGDSNPPTTQSQPKAADKGFSSSRDTSTPNPDTPPELHDLDSSSVPLPVDLARAVEDKKVAAFYERDWNYRGAYQRYKDAVRYAPDDADAHFGLAEMARHLGKKDEAQREYGAYLQLKPDGHRAHEAEKAIADLVAPGGQ